MKKLNYLLLTGGVIALALTLQVGTAQAVSISPLNFEVNGNPGDVISNIVRIYNDTEADLPVNMEIRDFVAAGERGEVLVKESGNTSYSLQNWVTLNPQTFTIPPKSSQLVEFTIRLPANAEPGGHYASVLASISGSSESGTGISQKIGSLLLLNVAGDVIENLGVSDFEAPAFSEYGPESLSARFTNDGSVHLKPRGFVLLKICFAMKALKVN